MTFGKLYDCKCGKPKCKCHEKKDPCYKAEKPLCPPEPTCQKEELICEEEVFDMSQIRAYLDCYNDTKLRNNGMQKGERLDFVLERIFKKLRNIDEAKSPRVPNKPNINSFQGVINDLYSVIEQQSKEIELLKQQIHEL